MIVFDTEATDLLKPEGVPLNEQPHLVEFAGIKLDDNTLKEKARLEFMVNPGVPLPPTFSKITGIREEHVKDKKPLINHYKELVDFFLGESIMVAHNVSYDKGILKFALLRLDKLLNFPWPPIHICTVEASYGLKNFRLKLGLLHEMATGKPHKDAHRAMGDVEALCTCVRWLKKEGHI
jgi:DNA polymerase III epsilon subunit-like protein